MRVSSPTAAITENRLTKCFAAWVALALVAVSSLGMARAATAPEEKPMLLPMPREYSARGAPLRLHAERALTLLAQARNAGRCEKPTP